MGKDGKRVGFYLSKRCVSIIKEMAEESGISQSAVIEISVREKVKRDEASGYRQPRALKAASENPPSI